MRDASRFKSGEWQGVRTEWAVQGRVVDAMIAILEKGTPNPFDKLIDAIINNVEVRTSRTETNASLKNFMKKYGRGAELTEDPYPLLLADLQEQRQRLLQTSDIPPVNRMSASVYTALNTRHQEWRAKNSM